jgi:hypothetical protein
MCVYSFHSFIAADLQRSEWRGACSEVVEGFELQRIAQLKEKRLRRKARKQCAELGKT